MTHEFGKSIDIRKVTIGAILIVATLVGLGIYGLRDGHILTLGTNTNTAHDPSGYTVTFRQACMTRG